jgi:hypothetical protein
MAWANHLDSAYVYAYVYVFMCTCLHAFAQFLVGFDDPTTRPQIYYSKGLGSIFLFITLVITGELVPAFIYCWENPLAYLYISVHARTLTRCVLLGACGDHPFALCVEAHACSSCSRLLELYSVSRAADWCFL